VGAPSDIELENSPCAISASRAVRSLSVASGEINVREALTRGEGAGICIPASLFGSEPLPGVF
jgi:hypothetical protein